MAKNLKIIIFWLVIFKCIALKASDFKPALFKSSAPSGFHRVESGAGAGKVLWFGDIDGDKYTDYISYKDSSVTELELYFWNQKQSQFVGQAVMLNSNNSQIVEIIVCDLDGNRLHQVLIIFKSSQNATLFSQIYSIKCRQLTCLFTKQNTNGLLQSMTTVPTVIDIDGSGKLYILAFKNNNQRWLLSYNQKQEPLLTQQPWRQVFTKSSRSQNKIVDHYSSMVDINGDCFSDFVLISESDSMNSAIEFHLKENNNIYREWMVLDTKANIKWMSFADFDKNGAVDLLLLLEEQKQIKLYILYNSNTPTDICSSNNQFPFSWSSRQKLILPEGYHFRSDSAIKITDFDLDGFPDIIGVFSINKFRKVNILLGYGSGVKAFDEGSDVISVISNPVQVCIYDFNENGKMDIIIINEVKMEDSRTSYNRISIVNNIIQDTFFIKIFPLLPNSLDLDSRDIAHAVGVTVQWRVTNLDGDKTINLINQKSQWNFGTLHLPFVVSGLGRTNNYIEDLTVGYPGYGQKSTWTPIIPNSQLMVKRSTNSEWPLQTLLKDNSRVYQMIYISVICLVLMGLLIVFLNWRENQEDKRDHYNFIHMIR